MNSQTRRWLGFSFLLWSFVAGADISPNANQMNPSSKGAPTRSFTIALVQMKVEGGRPEQNLERALERIAESASRGAALALLPEAMDLGWTHPSAHDLADAIPGGRWVTMLCEAARGHSIFVCAGLIERDQEKIYNAAVLIDDQGQVLLKHRKLNELDIAHHLYEQGDRLSVAHTRLGTIGVHICADAFVPGHVITRTLGYMGADLILSPSSWAVPPDHDNTRNPYGDLWRKAYIPPATDFRLWIFGVSNVGVIEAGAWQGWKCIGASLVIDPHGNEVYQGPYGHDADTLAFIEVTTLPRPARGTRWAPLLHRNSP